jgi:predicted RNA methylase
MILTKTAQQQALEELISRFQSSDRLSQDVVLNIMSSAYGGGSATGRWSWKQATDLIEAAMSSVLLDGNHQTLSDFRHLQSLVPHHRVRSEEQMELQQFSTPLQLAWICRELAQARSADTFLEPSAGTGILAAAGISRLKGMKPETLILNEISTMRSNLLREVFPNASIHSIDGEYINDLIPKDESPDVISMNPPFSVSLGRSKRNSDACFKHVRSALLRLKPGGRLVAIVAHWMSPEKHPEWFARLPAQLELSIFVQGKHYRFHGTTMDVRILVFNKIPQEKQIESIDLPDLTIEQIADIAISSTTPRLTKP